MTPRLALGDVFGRVFSTYGAQAGLFIPAALIVYLPVAILSALAASGEGLLLSALATVIALVGGFWLQGVVVGAVADIQDGRRDESIGSLFSKVGPVLGTVILAGILSAIGVVLGLLLLVVPGLVLLTWWSLIVPVIVLERTGVLRSFGRSREIVRGNGWRVFAIVVLLAILQGILGAILGGIVEELVDASAGRAFGELIVNVLVGPLSAIAVAVVYFELTRGRRAPAAAQASDAFGPAEPLGRPDAPFTPPVSSAPERPAPPPRRPKE